MSNVIISVENLGKCYRINHQQSGPNDGLRHVLNRWATAPLRALRAGRQNSETISRRPSASEDFWALRDVSFEIKQGEVVGIIGRNGAGKSTLLKILSRITEPTQGRVRIKGRVASLLEVGTGFHPELTGRENVYLNGAILGMSRTEIKKKFDEIVAFAEVEKFLDTPVKRYSSGMYVRLAFAVAAHLEPEILIVDEVLAVGDAQFQKKCLGKMQDVSRGGRTIIFVSHNIVSVQQLCTRVVHLSGGLLAGDGDPATQIHRYSGSLTSSTEILSLKENKRGCAVRGNISFVSVKHLGGTADNPWILPFGEPIRLAFTIRVKQRVQSLELGLGLFNPAGFEIISTYSSWHRALGPVAEGLYTLEVDYGQIEVRMNHYRFGIALKSDFGLEDYIPEAFDLEIRVSDKTLRPNLAAMGGAIMHTARFTLLPLR
jgi:lipopolysaccharide transport system ATP-binding protein